MSKIIKLDEAKKSKKIREKLITEKQELELEIHILQKKLEVIQGFLDGTLSDYQMIGIVNHLCHQMK